MQAPDALRKCVAFLTYLDFKEQKRKPVGTVFFVSVPGEKVSDAFFIYAVTARHTIDGLRDQAVEKVYMRVNLRGGGVDFIESATADWIFHENDSTDVAVLPVTLDQKFDIEALSVKEAVTPQTIGDEAIGIGDEVFLLGLFSNHYGQARNIPIMRVGNIAAMPEEPVYTEKGYADAYLVEARSIAGLSGSPVFVNVRGIRQAPEKQDWLRWGKTFWWVGLMQGHFRRKPGDENDIVKDDVDDAGGGETIHTGISIVVPVAKILELLNKPDLLQLRREWEKKILNKNAPILD